MLFASTVQSTPVPFRVPEITHPSRAKHPPAVQSTPPPTLQGILPHVPHTPMRGKRNISFCGHLPLGSRNRFFFFSAQNAFFVRLTLQGEFRLGLRNSSFIEPKMRVA